MNERKNMIFDRTLSPAVFEVAYRIAASAHPFEAQRQLLMVALRDHVTEQEAGNKTKKLLTRVWINPPPNAAPMIRWAVEHPEHFPDRRVLHLGALLATFPFAGSVAAVLGRAFALDGQLTGSDLRKRLVAEWGARTMIDLGASKTAGTIRNFDVLAGGRTSPLRPGSVLSAHGEAAAWLIHALLLTRAADSSESSFADAPELFWVKLVDVSRSYRLLEVHREGAQRLIYAVRYAGTA